MPTKNTSPSTANGMPKTSAYVLVVTFRQLMVAVSEQASVADWV
jgi:hypothetical protein